MSDKISDFYCEVADDEPPCAGVAKLRAELAAVKAERDALRADAERMEWMEGLTKRMTTWQGASRRIEKWLETDIFIRGPNVNIYLRDEYGRHIAGGTGSCLRLAIDAARKEGE